MSSRPISLVPVTLREAALDSPTFRGTVVHYDEQVEQVERWLDGYIKATTKLCNEVIGLDDVVNTFFSRAVPGNVSESILDHDYTLLAIQRFAEGSRAFWSNFITAAQKAEKAIVEPLVSFQRNELRHFKETRRVLDAAQSKYDNLLGRYASQSKSKEPSSLREDAFQLYEARKTYIKASLDFCVFAPTFRSKLDRVLTKILSDQWMELLQLRKEGTLEAERNTGDMHRIRSWSEVMENAEPVFRKQLLTARMELEARSQKQWQPARELEEYASSTVPYLTSRGHVGGAAAVEGEEVGNEKQGWLFMRTLTGKPTRSVWLRRWFFVKGGIFGWLVQGYQNGGVEESEKVGVLLCNIKPAFQEERRFCFEVKTKDTTILLQAETQADLTAWLAVFEKAKRTAVESGNLVSSTQAFSILPPSAPAPPSEPAFITRGHDGNSAGTMTEPLGKDGRALNLLHIPRHIHGHREGRGSSDPDSLSFDRTLTLPPPASGSSRATSMDISRKDNLSPTPSESREKMGQMLEAHKRSGSLGEEGKPSSGTQSAASAGISALIQASHNAIHWQPEKNQPPSEVPINRPSALAPASLVGAPSPVNLLTAAKVTSGIGTAVGPALSPRGHKKSQSLDTVGGLDGTRSGEAEYPSDYPAELRLQDEHFKMLFSVGGSEVLLLVFRGMWSPNDRQEIQGRCYVTARNFYFYSYHLGMVFTAITPLNSVTEVKAAPDRNCDYLFLQLQPEAKETTTVDDPEDEVPHITLKIFLEPIRLLQRRLHLLVTNANAKSADRIPVSELLAKLVGMEKEVEERGADTESWEEVGFLDAHDDLPSRKGAEEFRIHLDDEQLSYGKFSNRAIDDKAREASRLKMPSAPVVWEPAEVGGSKMLEKEYEVSAKALFHVIFGVKSAVFPTIYHQRRAKRIKQGKWTPLGEAKLRRDFSYDVHNIDFLGRSQTISVVDHQIIEKQEDHSCYVVKDLKTPWHLPYREDFKLASTIAITHVSKSKCKLSIWTSVVWTKQPKFSKVARIVQKQALVDLNSHALDVGDVVGDQIRKLGSHSRTKKALTTFGPVGPESASDTPDTEAPPPPGTELRGSRVPIKRKPLWFLVAETGLSMGESALSNLLTFAVKALGAAVDVVSAQRVLIALLLCSLVLNSLLGTRSTAAWWNERSARRFAEDVMVKPDGIMGRAVYLRDLEEMVRNGSELAREPSSRCFAKFRELSTQADLNTAANHAARGFAGASTRSMATRLKSGRQRLGSHRHDLLVALRVVNRIERDLVAAEYENWLVEENARCREAREMLGLGGGWGGREVGGGSVGGGAGDEEAEEDADADTDEREGEGEMLGRKRERERDREEDRADVQAWLKEYCDSCGEEWRGLRLDEGGLALGYGVGARRGAAAF